MSNEYKNDLTIEELSEETEKLLKKHGLLNNQNDRRIDDIYILENEVLAWSKDRTDQSIIINWQFTKNQARNKFEKSYPIT